MSLKSPITHVIFDMDGVLLDTEPLYSRAIQSVLDEFGKTYDWSLKVEMMGGSALASARYLVKALGLPISAEEIVERRKPALERLCANVPEIPGASNFVRALHNAGMPIAVATSSTAELFRLKSGCHAWFSLFQTVVCGDHPGVARPKPAPDIFLTTARTLGADPKTCLVFEDSPNGARAALAAGMQVIAIPDPALDAARFEGAELVIRNYAELDPGSLLALRGVGNV